MLKAGFGRRDVTPQLGVPLGGYAVPDRVAGAAADPLHANCIVLEDDTQLAVWIVLDWLSTCSRITNRIREAVAAATGIAGKAIHVSATHTHSAPNTLNFPCFGEITWDYIDKVIPDITAAVTDALNHRQTVQTGFAAIPSRTGVNRRGISVYNDTRFEADPYGPLDDTMTVLAFRHNSTLTGIIVHYGAHGTAMGVTDQVSRDWPGVMKDRIESQFDVPVIFINGALGDVGPRSNFRCGTHGLSGGTGDGIEAVREVGYRAASDAIEALLSIREFRDCNFSVRSTPMELPYQPLLPVHEAEKLLAAGNPGETAYARMVLEAHQQPVQQSVLTNATAFIIGPAAFLLMPGELFAGISLRLRHQSPYPYTMSCSLSDENLSYLVTRESRHRSGYEVEAGMYAGAYLLAENIDDILVENYIKLLTDAEA